MSLADNPKRGRTARRALYLAVAAVVAVPCLATAADETFVLRTTVNIPGAPFVSGDISFVDPVLHKYFFADRSNSTVDVIDTDTKAITQLDKGGFVGFTGNNDTSGPNGVLTVHRHAHDDNDSDGDDHGSTTIWVGDGNSTVKVLDTSGNVLHTISTGGTKRADELCYDSRHHLILVANDADSPPFVSFIPTQGPNANTVVKKVSVPEATNGIEQCQWDPRENVFYLNIPEVNGSGNDTADGAVYVLDPNSMSVTKKIDIPIANCAGPQGMAIGPSPQILLGCNAPSVPSGVRNSVVINEENGSILATLANEGGADEVWFNEGDGHYFLGNSSATPNRIIGVVDSRTDVADQSIIIASATPSTNKGSHSVAADQNRNEVYVPIPNNAGSTICPTPSIGCIAIFGPSGKDDHAVFVRRGH